MLLLRMLLRAFVGEFAGRGVPAPFAGVECAACGGDDRSVRAGRADAGGNQFIALVHFEGELALVHVAAGADVLEQSNHKMWPLGVFVSTGAVGLAVGMAYPANGLIQIFFLSLLLLVSVGVLKLPALKAPKLEMKKIVIPKIFWFVSAMLLFCITIRSFMGFARLAPFKGIAFLPLIIAVFVFAGKAMGGLFCDKFSTKWVILVSVPLSAILYFMGDTHFIVWGLAQFFVNISMPITLYLMYKILYDEKYLKDLLSDNYDGNVNLSVINANNSTEVTN